jgi:hypothetical protein
MTDLLDQKKVADFWDRLYKLAEKEFEKDCDGDLPIQIFVLDRTRCEPDHYQPIPYAHKAASMEELNKISEAMMHNVKWAIDSLQSFLRCREYEERRIKAQSSETLKGAGK